MGHRFDENKETGGWMDKDGWGFDLKLTLSESEPTLPWTAATLIDLSTRVDMTSVLAATIVLRAYALCV